MSVKLGFAFSVWKLSKVGFIWTAIRGRRDSGPASQGGQHVELLLAGARLGNLEVKTRSIETGERLIDWFLTKCSPYDDYSR